MRSTMTFSLAASLLALTGCEAGGSLGGGSPTPYTPYDAGRGGGAEVCGNGFDDDGDGSMDEDCGCSVGATQACWPGRGSDRGMGECRDGTQTCVTHGEFAEWGPCEGAAVPPAGATCCAPEFGVLCIDGKDNDCDAALDCADADCATSSECGGSGCTANEFSCADSFDEDCDGVDRKSVV